MKHMSKSKRPMASFCVWQIDAWPEGDGGWTWNDKFSLFSFKSRAGNIKKAFARRLRQYLEKGGPKNFRTSGWYHYSGLGRGWYYLSEDDYCVELRRRGTHEPVYACIFEGEK